MMSRREALPSGKLFDDHQSQPQLIMTATALNLHLLAHLNTASNRSTRHATAQLGTLVVSWHRRR
jgi:hypothetical protein